MVFKFSQSFSSNELCKDIRKESGVYIIMVVSRVNECGWELSNLCGFVVTKNVKLWLFWCFVVIHLAFLWGGLFFFKCCGALWACSRNVKFVVNWVSLINTKFHALWASRHMRSSLKFLVVTALVTCGTSSGILSRKSIVPSLLLRVLSMSWKIQISLGLGVP